MGGGADLELLAHLDLPREPLLFLAQQLVDAPRLLDLVLGRSDSASAFARWRTSHCVLGGEVDSGARLGTVRVLRQANATVDRRWLGTEDGAQS